MSICRLSFVALILCVAMIRVATAAAADIVLTTESWANNDAAFEEFAARIAKGTDRNLLARRNVRMLGKNASVPGGVQQLYDGLAGSRGDEGRVFVNGQPTVLHFYLGEPKTITEFGLFTFNIDARTNQDYEVRFARSSGEAGEMPQFREQPHLTTGDVILGSDSGGFHTRFAREDGAPLVSEKVDWVQIRVWRTYNLKAGEPAKTTRADGAASLIEIEIYGEPDDVYRPSAAELAFREALRNTPAPPEFVRRDSWQETLISGREAIRRWEEGQDQLAAFRCVAECGTWWSLGPLPGKEGVVQAFRSAQRIDYSQAVVLSDGRQLQWQERPKLADGQMHDLGETFAGEQGDVVLLCRDVQFALPPQSRELLLEIIAARSSARWLPSGRGQTVRPSPWQTTGGEEVRDVSGACQLLVQMSANPDADRRFYFAVQPNTGNPGAGDAWQRVRRREQLLRETRDAFEAPNDRLQLDWELTDGIWVADRSRMDAWYPGHSEPFLQQQYRNALGRRLKRLDAKLAEQAGVVAMTLAERRPQVQQWRDTFASAMAEAKSVESLRTLYYQAAAVDETITLAGRLVSMRLAVEDQRRLFSSDRYPHADRFLARIDELATRLTPVWTEVLAPQPGGAAADRLVAMKSAIDTAEPELLLANPLLDFERLLLVQGNPGFASNWGGANRLGNAMITLSPVRPDGKIETIYEGNIANMDLHWSGERVLFSDGGAIFEVNIDGSGLRRISPEDDCLRYDACYLPNGQIMFVSNACEQAVPCTGGSNVGNMHVCDADGTGERRITYDQDHNWNPTIMHDGRVLFTRWEYTDTPHYFSRLLFRMNPDGTTQQEYYGSNSYWPNAMYWPRPIPGHPTMVSCVVSGHHGVSRVGELVLLDPARGRHEADGAVRKLPGYGKQVEAITKDNLIGDVWPRFASPWPLAEPETHRGAGDYFLAAVQRDAYSKWELCLVDRFDNITTILSGGYSTPIPLRPRPMPPVVPSRIDPLVTEATVYLADVYSGPGLAGFPRGSITRLRIGSHHYRFAGNGDTAASAREGGWDVKKILGTVNVHEDGSAMFRVPANTPIFVQPLDAEGKAQQVMRSWFTAMPGEVVSCIGCHERQNDAPPLRYTMAAMAKRPQTIQPWRGATRGFSFDREVQPVLDRRCAGCHDGKEHEIDGTTVAMIDLRAKRLHDDPGEQYSPAYLALQQYVRRPGFEGDYHMPKPGEYDADTSPLVQMLKKGHHGVELTPDEWERLYTWIDFNVPYPANWQESHRPPREELVARRVKYKKLFAGIDDRDEDPLPLPPVAEFEPPRKPAAAPAEPLQTAGWPLAPEVAGQLPQQVSVEQGLPREIELDLGGGTTMPLTLVPAGRFVMGNPRGFDDERVQAVVSIDRPFYLGRYEVTNEQFNRFDPEHNNGVINERWKDRQHRGTPIDTPDLPVVRITWHQAMAFCHWLSQQSGRRVTLPTEAQWEWACRAGSAEPFQTGPYVPGQMAPFANVADQRVQSWNHGRTEPNYNDDVTFTAPGGRFAANAWGLFDMHGNAAEWTRTVYRPYPYDPGDGRNAPESKGPRVVRGGSWNDTLPFATAASRWRYEPYKPVYNVGFRVAVEP